MCEKQVMPSLNSVHANSDLSVTGGRVPDLTVSARPASSDSQEEFHIDAHTQNRQAACKTRGAGIILWHAVRQLHGSLCKDSTSVRSAPLLDIQAALRVH
jgi:hypothetical protein